MQSIKYRCPICGNIIEVLHNGGGPLVCCGQPMQEVKENSQDAALEKHVPVVQKVESGVRVQIGSILHPMTAEHYIEWIEVLTKQNRTLRQFLQPNMEPVAVFAIDLDDIQQVNEYCNLHGLWKNDHFDVQA